VPFETFGERWPRRQWAPGQGATVNVEAIDPGHGVGQELRAGAPADAVAGGVSDQSILGASGRCFDDVQFG